MIEFLFTFLPSTILGLIFIILGCIFKIKSNKKLKNGVKARVINVEAKEKRTKDGCLEEKKYILTLEYLYNGNLIKGKIESIYDYEIDSEIMIELYGDKVAFILSDKPNEVMDNYDSLNLKGYMILFGIGGFLLVFTILGIITELDSYIEKKYIYALVIILILCIFGGFLVIGLLKSSKLLKEVKYLEYEKIYAKIIDIKKQYSLSNNENIEIYYPIVQYNYEGKEYNKVIYEAKQLYDLNLGNEFIIYRHKRTGEVITDMTINKNQFNLRIYFVMIIIILAGIVLSMLLCI